MVSEMWHDDMPSKNAISGFECTGIYPVDHSKYLLERFDDRLLNKYDEWVNLSIPLMIRLKQILQSSQNNHHLKKLNLLSKNSTTSKQDQITSIPAPSFHIDIVLVAYGVVVSMFTKAIGVRIPAVKFHNVYDYTL